ncbi:hypothetical protein FRC07_006753 [Ceratobasidium sp. 392]|nr:hypothetical protein FRC07_006753 [Ceratobasidium sp. 392]
MFVLQECSICFEDFDNDRGPHSIPCGHVFCRPCLDSLISTPNCPNCRTGYTSEAIRKVVCAQQEQNESRTSESEGETLMWQAIQSSVETPEDHEQRKTLVKHNSPQSVRETGMSANLLIALDVLQMLVKIEQRSHSLKEKVDTARAVEESLCDRISMLEAQLSAKTGETSSNSHDIQLLLAQVRALQTTVHQVKTDTTNIVRHLNTEPPTSPGLLSPIIQTRGQPRPPTPSTPDASPNHTLRASSSSASGSRPSILRKPTLQNANNASPPTPTVIVRAGSNSSGDQPPQYAQTAQSPQQEYFLPHARTASGSGSGILQTPRQLMSPPVTPAIPAGRSLFGQSPPTPRLSAIGQMNAPLPPLPEPQSPRSPIIPSTIPFPIPQIGTPKPTPTPAPNQQSPSNPFRSPKPTPTSITFPPRSSATPAPTPAPTRAPNSNLITTAYPFAGSSPNELSFGSGESLELLDLELTKTKDWIYCRTEGGAVGYAPRSYLRIDSRE